MNNLKAFLFFISILFFASCSSDDSEGVTPPVEESISEVYFTFKSYLNESDEVKHEDWIIIHNENGELLDYKQYTDGDDLVFEGPSKSITDNITVTLFTVREFSNGDLRHFFNSDINYKKGDILDETPERIIVNPDNEATLLGDFQVNILGSPSLDGFGTSVVNKNGTYITSFSGSGSGGSWDYEFPTKLYLENDYFINILDNNSEYKYYEISDISDGDVFDITYAELNSYTDFITIDLPEEYNNYFLSSYGHKEGDNYNTRGYRMSYVFSSLFDPNPLQVNFLDRFTKYDIYFDINMDGYSYFYSRNYGNKTNELIIPEKPNMTVQNVTISNFQFTDNISYESVSHSWGSQSGTPDIDYASNTWAIKNIPNTSSTIGEIPEELFQLYPRLNVDDLKYSLTNFQLNEEERITVYKEEN